MQKKLSQTNDRFLYEKQHEKLFLNHIHKASKQGHTFFASPDERVELLMDMRFSLLGWHLLHNAKANGFWRYYLLKNDSPSLDDLTVFEAFYIRNSPTIFAMRESYKIMKDITQNLLFDGISIASIPCGTMSLILSLDFRSLSTFTLTGIEDDQESLNYAHSLAQKLNKLHNLHLIKTDIRKLNFKNKFDLITSFSPFSYLGKKQQEIIEFYTSLFDALKPGGVLITNFRTPGFENDDSPWNRDFLPFEDLRLDHIYTHEIINGRWLNSFTCNQMADIFEKSNFSELEIVYDRARICPTAILKKPY